MAADRVIRWTTAGAVVGVAAVAAVASYEHAYPLVRAHGEAGRTGRPVSLTVDGPIYASSIALLDSARRKALVPARQGGCYYHCFHAHMRDGKCSAKRVTAGPLEEVVFDKLLELVGDVEMTEKKLVPGRDYSVEMAKVVEQIRHL